MAATRTQISLTEEQRALLDEIRAREGKTLSEIVRLALDQFLARQGPSLESALDETFGAALNLSIPTRDEWDRKGRRAGPAPRGTQALTASRRCH